MLHPKCGQILFNMSRINQYLGYVKRYEDQILCMDNPHTELLTGIFVGLRNMLPWQLREFSYQVLFEGPKFVVEVLVDVIFVCD